MSFQKEIVKELLQYGNDTGDVTWGVKRGIAFAAELILKEMERLCTQEGNLHQWPKFMHEIKSYIEGAK